MSARTFSTLIGLAMALTVALSVALAHDGKETPDGDSAAGSEKSSAGHREARPAVIREVPRAQWDAMKRAGMVRPGCPVTRRAQLRRVNLDYRAFNGDLRRGHLIVRSDVADSVARIFTKLLEANFPIRRMVGVEKYGGDVHASLRADNTSAFNCRRPDQINAPALKSPHANGRAVDINPRENPWRDLRCKCWVPGSRNATRTEGPGKILRRGITWQAFADEGWIWQNIKVPDYMHFDTGYPSRRYRR